MEPEAIIKGSLLYADPMLQDPYFKRSVILLVSHDTNGSVGFIMNRRLDVQLNDVLPVEVPKDVNVFYGGPVNTSSLYYVHRLGPVIDESLELTDGLYWGGNFETIKSLLYSGSIKKEDIRFFVGYSGWTNGQLESELREKSWILSGENPDQLFIEKRLQQIWKNKMTSLGDKYALWANFPENPGLN